jgi:hypothetical protein
VRLQYGRNPVVLGYRNHNAPLSSYPILLS